MDGVHWFAGRRMRGHAGQVRLITILPRDQVCFSALQHAAHQFLWDSKVTEHMAKVRKWLEEVKEMAEQGRKYTGRAWSGSRQRSQGESENREDQ